MQFTSTFVGLLPAEEKENRSRLQLGRSYYPFTALASRFRAGFVRTKSPTHKALFQILIRATRMSASTESIKLLLISQRNLF